MRLDLCAGSWATRSWDRRQASSSKLQASSSEQQAASCKQVDMKEIIGYNKRKIMKRINHNDLSHWFLRDHATLPASYLKSCQKFFDELQAASNKRQATNLPQSSNINKTERKK
jgi:hypothetical protein